MEISTETIVFSKPNARDLINIARLSTHREPRSDYSLGYLYGHYLATGKFLCHFFDSDAVAIRHTPQNSCISEYTIFSRNSNNSKYYTALNNHILSSKDKLSFIGAITELDKNSLFNKSFVRQDRFVRDRDNDEYLISSKDHSRFCNKKIRHEKRAVFNFMKKYSDDIRYFELDLKKHDAASLLLNAYGSWSKIYKNNNNDIENVQYRYISQLLFHADVIGLKNITICHNDQIMGFALYELLPKHKAVLFHFLKVDYAFDHAFDFGIHVASNFFYSMGYDVINIEEDTGIEGIRNKKLHMAPIDTIRKWCYFPA